MPLPKAHTLANWLFCTALTTSNVWAVNCDGLRGTSWNVTYTITSSFTDTLKIESVDLRNGYYLQGKNQFGGKITGYCRNKTIFLVEDQGANQFVSGWFFNLNRPSFARYMGILPGAGTGSTTLETAWVDGRVEPVRSAIARVGVRGNFVDPATDRAMKLQELSAQRLLENPAQ